jgi:DNA mismatch repair ATPase MutS
VGQQYLYHRLRSIHHRPAETEVQEEVIKDLTSNREEIFKLQYWLTKLNGNRAYHLANLFQGKHLEVPRYFFLVPLLSFTALCTIILGTFNPSLYIILPILFPINAAVHYLNKRKVNVYIYSIPLLLSLNKIAKVFLKTKELSPISDNTAEAVKSIDQIKRRIAVFKLEQKIDSDLEVIYWFLLEILKITFLLEPLLLFSVIGRLRSDKQHIETVFEYVGKVDLLLSICSLREGLEEYCHPEINGNNQIATEDLKHPFVPSCVPNSITTANRSCLITGSNMSGKTTFIRAIGLNYLSGLVFNTCYAKSFATPLMQLSTIIRISDDVSNASSYFYKEVSSMKDVLSNCASDIPQLVLLDELFKGTNTAERIAAAKAVLSYLYQQNCIVFVASHDVELTKLLEKEYALYHFSESIQKDQVVFDYLLKPGVLAQGNAINILAINDFPEEIITEARAIVPQR